MSILPEVNSKVAAGTRAPATGQPGLFGSAAIYIGANILGSAIPLLLLPVLTRVLSPADFGIVAMFAIVQMMLLPLVGLSTKAAIVTRFFEPDRGDMRGFLTTCLVLTAASSAAVALLMWPLRAALASVTHLPAGWLFVAIVAAAAQFIVLICLALWQARGRAARVGTFQVLQNAANVGLSLLFVLGVGLGWEGRVLGQVGALVLFAALGTWVLWSASDLGWPPRVAHAREALAFGLPLIPHGVAAAAVVVVDRILLTTMVNVEQTGLYTAGLQVSLVLGLIVQAFNRAYQPWLFGGLQHASDDFRRRVVQGSYLYFFSLLAAAVMIGALAPSLARILLGEGFRPSAAFIPLLALGVAFGGMYSLVANYLILSRRTAWLSLASLISGALNIAGGILLIRRNGAIGAAQAFVLSQFVLFLITWWLASRAYAMPWGGALSRPDRA